MSLLWRNAAAFQRTALPWEMHPGEDFKHPVIHHVKDVGFAGLTGYHPDTVAEQHEEGLIDHNPHEEGDPWGDHYDEDLRSDTSPEPTPEEQAHYEEHGDHPESYYDRSDAAYEKAFHEKRQKELPDHYDDDVMDFASNYGDHQDTLKGKLHYGPVSLKQPVYATQSHVSQTHLDKYHADPTAQSDRYDKFGPEQIQKLPEYHGDKAPIFVTHQGRMHVIEGHHRVGAALQRGDSHITAFHYNADEHGFPKNEEDEDDWNERQDW